MDLIIGAKTSRRKQQQNYNFGLGKYYFNMTLKVQSIKKKVTNWTSSKFKTFKIPLRTMKLKPQARQHLPDKGLTRRHATQSFNGKRMCVNLTKEVIATESKCGTDAQHHQPSRKCTCKPPTRRALQKEADTKDSVRMQNNLNPQTHDTNVKWHGHLEKQFGSFFKNDVPYNPAISTCT